MYAAYLPEEDNRESSSNNNNNSEVRNSSERRGRRGPSAPDDADTTSFTGLEPVGESHDTKSQTS